MNLNQLFKKTYKIDIIVYLLILLNYIKFNFMVEKYQMNK